MPSRCVSLFALLLLLLVGEAVVAHGLAVNPASPTGADDITIVVTGEWPGGGGPALQQWERDGQAIRIDAQGVLPGIPLPLGPYGFDVDIGRLAPGHYSVSYYIEALAAPDLPAPAGDSPQAFPDAVLDFEVAAAPVTVPTLSGGALFLLGTLLLMACWHSYKLLHVPPR